MIIARTVAIITAFLFISFFGPSSSFAQNLSGAWVGNVTCRGQYVEPQPWPLTVTVAGANGNYTVAAATPNAAGAGVITGNRVTFTLQIFFNTAHFTGTIVGNRMSGSYVQGGAAAPCSWFAVAPAGVALTAPKPSLAPPKTTPASPTAVIGSAGTIEGKVTIFGRDGLTVAKSGSEFHLNDIVETGPTGRVQVLLKDDTVFSIGPNSKMVLDEFVYDPSSPAARMSARVLKGIFRLVTYAVQGGPRKVDIQINTPVGCFCIRGTEFEAQINDDESGYLKVFSGVVVFKNRKTGVDVTVGSSQMISIDADGKVGGPQNF